MPLTISVYSFEKHYVGTPQAFATFEKSKELHQQLITFFQLQLESTKLVTQTHRHKTTTVPSPHMPTHGKGSDICLTGWFFIYGINLYSRYSITFLLKYCISNEVFKIKVQNKVTDCLKWYFNIQMWKQMNKMFKSDNAHVLSFCIYLYVLVFYKNRLCIYSLY